MAEDVSIPFTSGNVSNPIAYGTHADIKGLNPLYFGERVEHGAVSGKEVTAASQSPLLRGTCRTVCGLADESDLPVSIPFTSGNVSNVTRRDFR